MTRIHLAALASPAILGLAAPLAAAPRLVSSLPAADAATSRPTSVQVRLTEAVQSGDIRITMTGMPGMANHPPMKVAGFKTTIGADGRSLVATLPRPLPVGSYAVEWTAGGGSGGFAFSVR